MIARCSMARVRPGSAFAMRLVVRAAEVSGASQLIPIDVRPRRLVPLPRRGVDRLRRPARRRRCARRPSPRPSTSAARICSIRSCSGATRRPAERGRLLMERYRELGARPTFTCAPYQLADVRPAVRRPRRVGRVERDRLLQQRARRAHESVRRLPGCLGGDHRSRAGSRVPPRRGPPAHAGPAPGRRRAGRRSATTTRSSRCSDGAGPSCGLGRRRHRRPAPQVSPRTASRPLPPPRRRPVRSGCSTSSARRPRLTS